MNPPRRDTPSGRAYLDLRALARRQGRPTDELLVLYVLERFLYRVSISAHRDRLVLKGGMLLAAFDERRPTADVDFLARAVDNEIDAVGQVVREVLAIPVEDGVAFEPDQLRAETIREADLYTGVRITVPARVDRARHPLRIDVNVGDPVTPAPIEVEFPALLDEAFPLVGYPLVTVLAEKIVTMLDRGSATTRDRDFADVHLLAGRHPIDAAELAAAIRATAGHRRSELARLRPALGNLASLRQVDWTRYLDRSGLSGSVPDSFAATIDDIIAFADPILAGELAAGGWNPMHRRWTPAGE